MKEDENIISEIIKKMKEIGAILLISVLGYVIGIRVFPDWSSSLGLGAMVLSLIGVLKCVDVIILKSKLSESKK